jgi:hypothetical protein
MCSYRSGDFRGIYAKYIILASHWEMPDLTLLCRAGGSDGGVARSCRNLISIDQKSALGLRREITDRELRVLLSML